MPRRVIAEASHGARACSEAEVDGARLDATHSEVRQRHRLRVGLPFQTREVVHSECDSPCAFRCTHEQGAGYHADDAIPVDLGSTCH
eukprot:3206335-Rhodomonas_salina.2